MYSDPALAGCCRHSWSLLVQGAPAVPGLCHFILGPDPHSGATEKWVGCCFHSTKGLVITSPDRGGGSTGSGTQGGIGAGRTGGHRDRDLAPPGLAGPCTCSAALPSSVPTMQRLCSACGAPCGEQQPRTGSGFSGPTSLCWWPSGPHRAPHRNECPVLPPHIEISFVV